MAASCGSGKRGRDCAVRLDAYVGREDELRRDFLGLEPFPHLILDDFLSEALVDRLEEELLSREFYTKENDLFSFFQSADLAESSAGSASSELVQAIYSEEFRSLVTAITGVERLDATIDLTSSVYEHKNHLLCHDDEMSSRRVAFILYLVHDGWTAQDGGTLDLFTVNSDKLPNGIFKRVVPRRNSLLFFEVSDRSYHQVAEVLTANAKRLSVGGWFHGPRASTPRDWKPLTPTFDPVKMAQPLRQIPLVGKTGEQNLAAWVNPVYLKPSTVKQIASRFEEESCVQLHDFFVQKKAETIQAAFVQSKRWTGVGPFHKQRIDVLEESGGHGEENKALQELLALLRSRDMAAFLERLTGVQLVTSAAQLRRFAPGCYSLVHDRSEAEKKLSIPPGGALDFSWTIVDPGSDERSQGDGEPADAWENAGGQLVYCADGEEEPLLVSSPTPNMLTLVYRSSPDTQSFVKYVNHTAPSARFDATVAYWTKDSD